MSVTVSEREAPAGNGQIDHQISVDVKRVQEGHKLADRKAFKRIPETDAKSTKVIQLEMDYIEKRRATFELFSGKNVTIHKDSVPLSSRIDVIDTYLQGDISTAATTKRHSSVLFIKQFFVFQTYSSGLFDDNNE